MNTEKLKQRWIILLDEASELFFELKKKGLTKRNLEEAKCLFKQGGSKCYKENNLRELVAKFILDFNYTETLDESICSNYSNFEENSYDNGDPFEDEFEYYEQNGRGELELEIKEEIVKDFLEKYKNAQYDKEQVEALVKDEIDSI